jgi:hypothetical protein
VTVSATGTVGFGRKVGEIGEIQHLLQDNLEPRAFAKYNIPAPDGEHPAKSENIH